MRFVVEVEAVDSSVTARDGTHTFARLVIDKARPG
jgi:hypothetical protein